MLQKLLQLIFRLLRPTIRESEIIEQPKAIPSNTDKKGSRRINSKGLQLIKEFEGCKLQSYQDIVGVWTIGFGHTRTAGPNQFIGMDEAERLLAEDLKAFELGVEARVKVPVTDNQFSALVCFAFNVGLGALENSTLLRLLNSGATATEVALQFHRWNKAGGKEVAGLSRRRKEEALLFLSVDSPSNNS